MSAWSETSANRTATLASGAGATLISSRPGRLCTVVVTATGTGSSPVLIYDDATGTGTGTVLCAIPGNAAVGEVFELDMPAANGLTAVGSTNSPALTIGYR